MKAYVEIHTDPGSDVERIAAAVRNVEGVKEACRVVGRADILVSVEGKDLRHISDIISQKICAVRGISAGETLVCVDSMTMQQYTNPTTTQTQTQTPSGAPQEIPAITFS